MFSANDVVYNGGSCCYLRTQRAEGGSNLATQKTIVTAMMLRRGWKQRQVTKQTQCKQEIRTFFLGFALLPLRNLDRALLTHRTSAPVGPQVLPRVAVLVLCRVQLQAKHATSYSAVVIEKYTSLEKAPASSLQSSCSQEPCASRALHTSARSTEELIANLHAPLFVNYTARSCGTPGTAAL